MINEFSFRASAAVSVLALMVLAAAPPSRAADAAQTVAHPAHHRRLLPRLRHTKGHPQKGPRGARQRGGRSDSLRRLQHPPAAGHFWPRRLRQRLRPGHPRRMRGGHFQSRRWSRRCCSRIATGFRASTCIAPCTAIVSAIQRPGHARHAARFIGLSISACNPAATARRSRLPSPLPTRHSAIVNRSGGLDDHSRGALQQRPGL